MRVAAGEKGEVVIFDFNRAEALKIAVHLEKEGIAFYNQLKQKVADDETKHVLTFLSAEEAEHLVFFEKELTDELGDTDDGFEEDDLLDFVESGVFCDKEAVPFDVNVDEFDSSNAIKLAIEAEERSVQFYDSILKNTTDDKGRQTIQEIINQEAEHAVKLKNILAINSN